MNKENKNENKNNLYENFAAGVVVLRADNANWNADFSGWPRKLPNGGFYSTDKALKYAIRKYLKEVKNQTVLFWRVYNEKGEVGNLSAMLKENLSLGNPNATNVKDVLKAIDVRLFGGAFTIKKNQFSITGPVQITYGVDVWNKGHAYVNQIQSPKYEPKEGGSEEKYGSQTTLGSEVRLTEAHYAFDFTVNPNNLEKDESICAAMENENKNLLLLSKEDVNLFKDSLIMAPNYVTSTTKVGVFTELVIFAEFKKDNNGNVPLTPILKNMIKIEEVNETKRRINLKEVVETLKEFGAESIQIFYTPHFVEIAGVENIDQKNKIEITKIFTNKTNESG